MQSVLFLTHPFNSAPFELVSNKTLHHSSSTSTLHAREKKIKSYFLSSLSEATTTARATIGSEKCAKNRCIFSVLYQSSRSLLLNIVVTYLYQYSIVCKLSLGGCAELALTVQKRSQWEYSLRRKSSHTAALYAILILCIQSAPLVSSVKLERMRKLLIALTLHSVSLWRIPLSQPNSFSSCRSLVRM